MIRINVDAFSHSWKSMFAHSWPNVSAALCIMVQLAPHKQVPCRMFATSTKKIVLALHLRRHCIQEDTPSSNCRIAAWFSTRKKKNDQSTKRFRQFPTLCLKLLFSQLWHLLSSSVTLNTFLFISSTRRLQNKTVMRLIMISNRESMWGTRERLIISWARDAAMTCPGPE